jgi:hypothetical protein
MFGTNLRKGLRAKSKKLMVEAATNEAVKFQVVHRLAF